eukprot:2552822-Rhodomonas_salina.1
MAIQSLRPAKKPAHAIPGPPPTERLRNRASCSGLTRLRTAERALLMREQLPPPETLSPSHYSSTGRSRPRDQDRHPGAGK